MRVLPENLTIVVRFQLSYIRDCLMLIFEKRNCFLINFLFENHLKKGCYPHFALPKLSCLHESLRVLTVVVRLYNNLFSS